MLRAALWRSWNLLLNAISRRASLLRLIAQNLRSKWKSHGRIQWSQMADYTFETTPCSGVMMSANGDERTSTSLVGLQKCVRAAYSYRKLISIHLLGQAVFYQ